MPVPKRVNLAEGTSIIGQRPAGGNFSPLVKPLVMDSGMRGIKSSPSLSGFCWRCAASVTLLASMPPPPSPFKAGSSRLCAETIAKARKLARAWDKPEPVAECTSVWEKGRAERFDFSVGSSNRACVSSNSNGLDFRVRRSAYFYNQGERTLQK